MNVLKWRLALTAASFLCVALPASAATIVNVQTSLGDYKIELFEDLAPATVERFLSDVEAGAYHFTMVHYAANTFFAGGRYEYNTCNEGPVDQIPSIAPITAEETGLAHVPGTLAMVRDVENPNLVTGEWIINLGTNTPTSPGTAPIVIGEIVEGYNNADVVLDQWKVSMDGASPAVPTINYDGFLQIQCGLFGRDNLVFVTMEVESSDLSIPANYYDAESGLLHVTADAGAAGMLSLSFSLTETDPDVVIQALADTVAILTDTVPGIGSFDLATNTLTLPELVVDGQVVFTNLVFTLTDAEQLLFTLESFE